MSSVNVQKRIAVVGSSSFGGEFPEHLARLREFADVDVFTIPKEQNNDPLAIARTESPESLIKKLQPYDGIIASVDPVYTEEVLQNLHRLQVIARHGIGYNNIKFMEALDLGIAVTKVVGWVEQASVAELAVGLALGAARKITEGHIALTSGGWEQRKFFSGPEIAGSTVGIIGCGNIGSGAVKLFKAFVDLAPGGRVLVYDPNVNDEDIRKLGGIPVSKQELVENSDFISLHSLLSEETKGLLGAQEFASMKPGTIIINTARGALVDEAALAPHLSEGGKLFYASDVFAVEPIAADNPLLKAKRVLLTPHLGGYGNSSKKGMGDACVGAMEEVFVHQRIPEDVKNERGQSVGCLVPEHQAAVDLGTVTFRFPVKSA